MAGYNDAGAMISFDQPKRVNSPAKFFRSLPDVLLSASRLSINL